MIGGLLLWKGRAEGEPLLPTWRILAMVAPLVILAVVLIPAKSLIQQSYIWAERKNPEELYSMQGVTTSVSVVECDDSPTARRRDLLISNLAIASTGDRHNYHAMLSNHALLVHPDPQDVMVIGLGSGESASTALEFDEVRNLEILEISPEVITALPFFLEQASIISRDERVKIIVEDARIYLFGSEKKFDLILSDVLTTSTTGTTHLLSVEFFALCKSRLKPNGMMALVMHPFQNELPKMIVNTFTSVFPHWLVFQHGGHGRLYVLGSVDPIPENQPWLSRRIANPTVQKTFERLGVSSVEDFWRGIQPTENIQAFIKDAPIVTDDQSDLDAGNYFW